MIKFYKCYFMNTTITVVSPHTFYGNLVSLLLLITFTHHRGFSWSSWGPDPTDPWPAASTEQRVDGEDDQLDLEYSTASRSTWREREGEGGLIKTTKKLRVPLRNGGVFVFFCLVRFGGWWFLFFFKILDGASGTSQAQQVVEVLYWKQLAQGPVHKANHWATNCSE